MSGRPLQQWLPRSAGARRATLIDPIRVLTGRARTNGEAAEAGAALPAGNG